MEKNKVSGELLYKDECYRIQGCIFEVNRKLETGCRSPYCPLNCRWRL
jgi:hypothetical protein